MTFIYRREKRYYLCEKKPKIHLLKIPTLPSRAAIKDLSDIASASCASVKTVVGQKCMYK